MPRTSRCVAGVGSGGVEDQDSCSGCDLVTVVERLAIDRSNGDALSQQVSDEVASDKPASTYDERSRTHE